MKILIIGFQHSGTTMLRNLINAHSDVSVIYNENRYIELDKSRHWIMGMIEPEVYPDGKKMSWGEKIPWVDGEGDRVIKLSRKWFSFFGKKSRIIHIIRHPIDVALSINKSDVDSTVKLWEQSIPKVIDFLDSDDRCATILFEDLLDWPFGMLDNMFQFLKLKRDPKRIHDVMNTELKFGKINSDRAYAFKNLENFNKTYDYIKMIGRIKTLI